MENATATVVRMLYNAIVAADGNPHYTLTVTFGLGILLHVFAFRLGEWDLAITKIVPSFFFSFVTIAIGLTFLKAQETKGDLTAIDLGSLGAATTTALQLFGCLIAGSYSSILVYRLLFHRLNRFPGPFFARLSNLWISSKIVPKMKLYRDVQALHRKYGDIVRLGPSELSIISPKAIAVLHSHQTICVKGPWYDLQQPMQSLLMIRDKKDHARRRRTWDHGFNTKALHNYEPRVFRYTTQLLDQIESKVEIPMNITDWFSFYSFDVMGDLSFGKSFGMLREGVRHYFINSLHTGMAGLGLFSHMLWLFPILKATPVLNAEHKRFQAFVKEQTHKRMQNNKPDQPDIFSWLLEEYMSLEKPTMQDLLNLYGDAYLIIVAGSDTTSVVLTCMFYELACHPGVIAKLRVEIDTYYQEHDAPELTSLAKLPYLQACINETLRLHPTVPSGLQRMTPSEGVQIDDVYIPGNIIVQIPTYTMFRDERNFLSPNDYIPERWTTQPDLVKTSIAFVPFSTGDTSCIGKQLGLMEIRYVASQILRTYDFTFAPGQTPKAFVQGQKDAFILSLPALNLVFSKRQ